jgi:putative CocE/NonD family hydrolase
MASQVTVPTLILMGWQDEWNLGAGTRMFQLLPSTHKRIILQNGGHGVGAIYKIDLDATMRWLDRWVKGTKNGMDEEPPVTVYWEVHNATPTDGSHATPGWTTGYANWPPPNTQWVTFYLTPDGKLSRDQPAADSSHNVRSYLYPSGTELVGTNEQFALAPYHLGALTYRTEPLAEDMVILGLPQLRFFVSSEQTNTDFFFTLKDIDAAGNTLFLQRDFLRASMRAVDEAKSTPDEIIQSYNKNEELVPGKIYEINLSIPSIGAVVRKGHRLELSILAPSPIPAPVMGGVPIGLPSLNTVYHGPDHPSALRVPVIPGEKAQADAPECGSLPFQPCRHAPAHPVAS